MLMSIKTTRIWSVEDLEVVQALEVTPPGMEPVVRALKKKGNIDNPWAVAWAMRGQERKVSLKATLIKMGSRAKC